MCRFVPRHPLHSALPVSRRAGVAGIFRLGADESDVPEGAVRRVAPLVAVGGWPRWRRPARLFVRPEMLSGVVALLPDHPPRRFSWRGKTYQVAAGDGPERIQDRKSTRMNSSH